MKKLAAVTIILLQMFTYQTAQAEMFYVGAMYGQTQYETGVTALTGTATLDDETTSSKVLVGMNIGFGLMAEVYYADMGDVTFSANSGDTYTEAGVTETIVYDGLSTMSQYKAYGINAVYKLGFGIASVYAKAGMLHWESENTVQITSFGFKETTTTSGNEPLVGAGVEFTLLPLVSIRLDYELTKIDEDDVTNISAGVVVGF